MQRIATTSFGRRPVTAGQLAALALAEAPAPHGKVNKWQVFRDLTTARVSYGLSSRALTVLNALLSFHPSDGLEDIDGPAPLIVFPSNRALCERAHGMAESTLRRHLAALVEAGMIARHDSPNGKRFAARDTSGALAVAYGFDLRPLLVRAAEFAQAAQATRDAQEALRRRREAVVIGLRDVTKLLDFLIERCSASAVLPLVDRAAGIRRALRRKLEQAEIAALTAAVSALRLDVDGLCAEVLESEETDCNDVQNERHYQNSKPDTFDSERCLEQAGAEVTAPESVGHSNAEREPVPLPLVRKACTSLSDYVPDEIRHWPDFLSAVEQIRPWLGISADAWLEAKSQMGAQNAATVAACILQRSDRIASPGGYLRALTRKAADGRFSPAPMVMALLNAA